MERGEPEASARVDVNAGTADLTAEFANKLS
jgi:hypothetical protein